MKQLKIYFTLVVLLFCSDAGSIYAQTATGVASAANLAAHGVMAIVGGNHKAKQEKIIDKSTTEEKINGSNVSVLRVKDSEIKSKAKSHIIALQNRLDQYKIQYKNNEAIDIPKNDSDLIAIQDIDENWPAEDYASELKAYKRYAVQQKQKAAAASASNLTTLPGNLVKKDSTSEK